MSNRKTLEEILQSADVAHRWASLLCELETIATTEQLSDTDRAALIELVYDRITTWPTEERVAPDSWMYEISSSDVWEYGVNGVHSEERFEGFTELMPWLFPLATSIRITDPRVNFLWEPHIAQFQHLSIWKNIQHLYIAGPIGVECRTFIKTDPRFAHMKSITVGKEVL